MSNRRDPFEEMNRMFEQMRKSMLETGLDTNATELGVGSAPRASSSIGRTDPNVTTESTDDGFVVIADLPGFETGDIDLRFDDEVLSIAAERDVSEDREGVTTRRRRSVRERVRVPGSVLVDEITATYRNGVMEVHLPAEAEVVDGNRIDIE